MSIVSQRADRVEDFQSFLFRHESSRAEKEQIIWSAFKRGNRKALDYIFEKYIRLLYAYGGKLSKDQGLIEDCIQDLFIEMWNKRESLADTDNIKLYLLKSLRRRIVRRLMTEQRIPTEPLLEEQYEHALEFSAEFHLIREQSSMDKCQEVTKALGQLSKRQREAVYLKFFEKMSYEDIAAMMNLTVKSAYKLMGKAIESLRKTIRFKL